MRAILFLGDWKEYYRRPLSCLWHSDAQEVCAVGGIGERNGRRYDMIFSILWEWRSVGRNYCLLQDERLRSSRADVRIFSSQHVSGESLAKLTGIAAILRFPMPSLYDNDDDEDDLSDDDEDQGGSSSTA